MAIRAKNVPPRTDPCGFCNIAVAFADPERVELGPKVFHGKCWRKVKHLPVQLNFSFGKEVVTNLSAA